MEILLDSGLHHCLHPLVRSPPSLLFPTVRLDRDANEPRWSRLVRMNKLEACRTCGGDDAVAFERDALLHRWRRRGQDGWASEEEQVGGGLVKDRVRGGEERGGRMGGAEG